MTAFKEVSRRHVLAAAGASTASLAGCFDSNGDTDENETEGVDVKEIEPGGTLSVGVASEIEALNPLTASSAPASALLDLLYQPGTLVEPDGFEAMPWVFTDWDDRETADGFEIHFDVRDDLEWTDGEPLTPADARFTYEYYIEHDPPRFSTAVGPMESVGESDAGYDLVLTLSETVGSYETEQLSVALLPEHVWEDVESYADHQPDDPVGLGPGRLDADEGNGLAVDLVSEWPLAAQEWVDEHERLLSGGPYLDGLRLPVFDGPNALHRAFLSGEIDAMYGPDFDTVHAQDVEQRDGIGLVSGEDDGVGLYTLNTRVAPLDDQAFRQALAMAMDRDRWVDELKLGYAVSGTVVVPPAFEHLRPETAAEEAAQDAAEEPPEELRALDFRGTDDAFDAAPVRGFLESGEVIDGASGTYAAAEYPGSLTSFGRTSRTEAAYDYEFGDVRSSVLEEAGVERELYVDGQTIEERSDGPLTMLAAPRDERPLVSEFTQGYVGALHELGVPIETEVRTAGTIADRVYLDTDFGIAPMDWSGFSAHGASTLYDLFHSDNADENAEGGFAYNAAGYGVGGSDGADEAIEELRAERDEGRRNELVRELAERLYLEAPVLVRSYDLQQWPVNAADYAGFLSGIPGVGSSNLRLQALTVHQR